MKKLPFFSVLLILVLLCSCTNKHNENKHNSTTTDTIYIHDIVVVSEKIHEDIPEEIIEENNVTSIMTKWLIAERMPSALFSTFGEELIINKTYQIDGRLNPLYLELYFDNDTILDCAFTVTNIETQEKGFAIVRGNKKPTIIIGAGQKVKGVDWKDWSFTDIWRVIRNKTTTESSIDNSKPSTFPINNEGIEVEKSEVGGGIFIWINDEVRYVHQTC